MQINDLNYKNSAPNCGVVLAYTRDKIVLEKYESIEDIPDIIGSKELLEIHLFDEEREYRAVRSESRRWNFDPDGRAGIIETTVTGKKDDDVYAVDVLLDKGFRNKLNSRSIKIVNHVVYDNNGAATIDNYRLVEGGK